MCAHYNTPQDWNSIRRALIGVEDSAAGRSYYPELRRKNFELERFRVLLDAAEDAILLADAQSGAIVDMNRAFAAVQHGAASDGATLGDVMGASLAKRLLGLSVNQETMLTSQLGTGDDSRVFDISAHVVLFHEHPYVVVVGRDVSEREAARAELLEARDGLEVEVAERTAQLTAAMEELRAASTAKSQFLASMSHELRTPLNSIIGFSGTMLQGLAGELSPEQEHQLTMISRSGKHLLGLINDLLDLSRIESGEIGLNYAECSVATILQDALDMIAPLAAEKNLSTSCDVVPSDLTVNTDCNRLHEVLINLIGNAVKFTDSGSVTLRGYREDDAVHLDVRDTGCGIDPEHRDHIWEYYRRLGRPHTGEVEGTGLGLAISSRLVTALGGTIEVTSTVNEGSTFTVRLPAVPPEASR